MHVVAESPARIWNKRHGNAPSSAVYVGRPSKWGNPFVVNNWRTPSRAVQEFTDWLLFDKDAEPEALRQALLDGELTERELVCWCVDENGIGVCHARVLARVQHQLDTPGWEMVDVKGFWWTKLKEAGYWV